MAAPSIAVSGYTGYIVKVKSCAAEGSTEIYLCDKCAAREIIEWTKEWGWRIFDPADLGKVKRLRLRILENPVISVEPAFSSVSNNRIACAHLRG